MLHFRILQSGPKTLNELCQQVRPTAIIIKFYLSILLLNYLRVIQRGCCCIIIYTCNCHSAFSHLFSISMRLVCSPPQVSFSSCRIFEFSSFYLCPLASLPKSGLVYRSFQEKGWGQILYGTRPPLNLRVLFQLKSFPQEYTCILKALPNEQAMCTKHLRPCFVILATS